jgi:hypothetical protein
MAGLFFRPNYHPTIMSAETIYYHAAYYHATPHATLDKSRGIIRS